jgi:dTDP-4-dehydrorhamnose reductase
MTRQVFVIGKEGFLAGKILSVELGPDFRVVPTSRNPFPGEVPLNLKQPDRFPYQLMKAGDVVLLLAGISSPDLCHTDQVSAYRVNVTGTCRFTDRCVDRGAKIVFFSSDTVYGESSELLDEDTIPIPVGEYAMMKHEVEKRFQAVKGFVSLRLSYVFSSDDRFTRYLRECASSGKEAVIYHPYYRKIVFLDDVLALVRLLVWDFETAGKGIVNVGGPDLLSRMDLAEILRKNLFPSLKYQLLEPGEEFFLSRPKVVNMESQYLVALLGRGTTPIAEAADRELRKGIR